MKNTTTSDQRKAHLRQLSNSLIENSTLRTGLNDDQADQLLDWGLNQLDTTSTQVAHLPLPQAAPILDTRTTHITTVMRYLNRFVRDISNPKAEADIPLWCDNLCQGLDKLQGITTERQAQIAEFVADKETITPDILFNELLSILQESGEEE